MIPTELRELLEPLERFETIRKRVVFLGSRLCDLSYGNPYDGVEQATRDALRGALDATRVLDLQYTPHGGQVLARRAVAEHLTASHGLRFTSEDVVLTPGATAALHLALRSASAPGSEVILPFPCWLDYPLYVRALGLTPVLVPLSPGTLDLDVPAIEQALTGRTAAVVLSHPANPTGRNYDRSALTALGMALGAAETRTGRAVTLIADEVHRDFLPAGSYQTAAAFWPRTVLVYSFGKYHHLQGQRLGYAAVSPDHPSRAEIGADLRRWIRVLGFLGPTALMQRATPRLLGLRHDVSPLAAARARLARGLVEAGYDVARGEGTRFVYVRTPDERDDFQFVEDLAGRGMLALPAPLFHHSGYFRLAVTTTGPMLDRALAILRAAASPCANSV